MKRRPKVLLAIPILFFCSANVLNAQEIVKGQTVQMITYAQWGKDDPEGTIKLAHIKDKRWIDKSSNILNTWKEQRRDEWSVDLISEQTQRPMKIDLRNNYVTVNGQVVYKILAASTKIISGFKTGKSLSASMNLVHSESPFA